MIEFIITSSILILLITAVRYIFKGKISMRMQYALWLIVAIRLLVPFQLVESSLSVLNFIPTPYNEVRKVIIEEHKVPKAMLDNVDDRNTVLDHSEYIGSSLGKGKNISRAVYPPQNFIKVEEILTVVWIAGIALFAVTEIVSNIYFSANLKKHRTLLNTNTKLRFYETDRISSPCLYGVFRPTVYVTPMCNEQEFRHIITHELTHYRHKDNIWAAVRIICVCVHWYNPLVWMAAMLSKRDAELACDESTVKSLGETERIDYGRTLVSMTARKLSPFDLLSGATTMVSGKRGLKERIVLLTKKPKVLAVTVVLLVLIVVIASACTFSDIKFDEHDTTFEVYLEADGKMTLVDSSIKNRIYRDLYPETAERIMKDHDYVIMNHPFEETEIGNSLILMDSDGNVAAMRDGFSEDEDRSISDLISRFNMTYTRLKAVDHSELSQIYQIKRNVNGEEKIYYAYIDPSTREPAVENDGEMVYVKGEAFEAVKSLLDAAELYTEPEEYKLENAVNEAIIENDHPRHGKSEFVTAAYQVLGEEREGDILTLYMQVLYQGYDFIDDAMVSVSGSSYPAAVTFEIDHINGEYILEDYWIPLLGSDYYPSIKDKFPAELVELTDDRSLVEKNQQECDNEAQWYLENRESEEELFDEVVRTKGAKEPIYSSTLSASSILRGREDATLRYIYKECLKGGQTDERSKYMYKMMCDILDGEQIKLEAETLQEYFDEFLEYAKRLLDSNGAEEIEKYYPKTYMLLEVADLVE